ncbi:MAG: PEGA domain-containing protein [Nanoarchaeota archaeon]
MPDNADIFMDGVYSGKSPLTLNNVPTGPHKVIIKKEGYGNFISEINIEAGRKTFLEAELVLIPAIKEEADMAGVTEEKEEAETGTLKANGMVNIGEKFVIYYDFSKGKTTEIRQIDSDVFSKRFSSYLVFTRFDPVSIKTIDKSIDNIKREDCIGIKGQFEYLHSGQSLCVITKEDEVVALGGTWEDTENAKLTWKLFS